MKTFERKIRHILKAQGMSFEKLAQLTHMSRATFHSIFKTDDARVTQLRKIAEAAGVELDYFFKEDDQLFDGGAPLFGGDNHGVSVNTMNGGTIQYSNIQAKLQIMQIQYESEKNLNNLLQSRIKDKEERIYDKEAYIEALHQLLKQHNIQLKPVVLQETA